MKLELRRQSALVWAVVVLIVVVPAICLQHKSTPCTPKLSCKCEFPYGQGLDLTPLRKFNSSWVSPKMKPDHFISVNPCGSMFKNETEECYGASVCLNVTGNLTDLGSVKDSQLIWESLGRTPSIVFTKVINSETITTTILLKCDDAQTVPKLEFITAIREKYTVRLTTKEACLKSSVSFSGGGTGHHWGVFSILSFLALILLIVYFVAGFVVLKYIRGAQGLEAIPNHEFWLSIPKQLKDGVTFLANGCKRQESYDRI